MAKTPSKPATPAELASLPPTVKGEIIDGVLFTQPRARSRHARVVKLLGHRLFDAFDDGLPSTGGWWVLPDADIAIGSFARVCPDLAGWRRHRMDAIPQDAVIRVVPDFVCEVLLPSSRGYDLIVKRRFYRRLGVTHLWHVDLEARALMVNRLIDGHWLELAVFGDEDIARAEPFDTIDIRLADLWG